MRRAVDGTLAVALRAHPIVVLRGPRRVGISTILRSLPGHRYVPLDDPRWADLAARDPDDLLALGPRLAIDQIQRVPALLPHLARTVDRAPAAMGRFVLAASGTGDAEQDDPLGGRTARIRVWPLTRRERRGEGASGRWDALATARPERWPERLTASTPQREEWTEAVRRGGYPQAALGDLDPELLGYRLGSVAQAIEEEVSRRARSDRRPEIRRLMRAVCRGVPGLLRPHDLARETEIPYATLQRWLAHFRDAHLWIRARIWSPTPSVPLRYAPRALLGDTGVALHLTGGEPRPVHLTNLVFLDLLAWNESAAIHPWETRSGMVGVVVWLGDAWLGIAVRPEVRWPTPADAADLRRLRDRMGERWRGGLLLHDGEEVAPLGRGIVAAPWWAVV